MNSKFTNHFVHCLYSNDIIAIAKNYLALNGMVTL